MNLDYYTKISAVIPTYNSARFITETLESLLNQTLPLSEIIIVDDKSTDETRDVIRDLQKRAKNRIRLHCLEENSGSSIARNIGMEIARNDWVLLMDHDDIAEPNLLELEWKRMLQLGKESPGDWVLVHSAYHQITENGDVIPGIFRWKQVKPEEVLGYELIRNRLISNSGVILNGRTARKVGGYDPQLRYSQDWDLWLRLAQVGGFGYIDEPLVRIRRHPNNTSSNIQGFLEDERKILNRYSIQFMEEAIHRRHLPWEVNQAELASLLYRLDYWEEGYRIIRQVVQKKSDLPMAHFILALYFLKKSDWVNAATALEQTVGLAPNHGAALNNLGVIYAIKGNISKSAELLKTALKFFPSYVDALHNIRCLENFQKLTSNDFKFTWRELRPVLTEYVESK